MIRSAAASSKASADRCTTSPGLDPQHRPERQAGGDAAERGAHGHARRHPAQPAKLVQCRDRDQPAGRDAGRARDRPAGRSSDGGRHRASFRQDATSGCQRGGDRSRLIFRRAARANRAARAQAPAAVDLLVPGARTGRRIDQLRPAPRRQLPTCGHLCRSHLQWCQAERAAGRVVDQARAHRQSQDRQGPRPDRAGYGSRSRRRGDRMKRRAFIRLLGGATAWPLAARAQQPSRVWQIGILHGVPAEASLGVSAFRQRLGALGYTEGQNSIIEYRWSDQMGLLPALAATLTELKVDVIVAGDGTRAKAAEQATQEIPIVVAVFTDDPVAAGLITSLGHPGGNITGLALFAPEMSAKRLELLRDIVPRLTRVGILSTRESVTHPALLRAANQAALQLGIDPVEIEVANPNDLDHAFDLIRRERVDAVEALQGIEFYRIRGRIAELGLKHR